MRYKLFGRHSGLRVSELIPPCGTDPDTASHIDISSMLRSSPPGIPCSILLGLLDVERGLTHDRRFLVSDDVTLTDVCFAGELTLFADERAQSAAMASAPIPISHPILRRISPSWNSTSGVPAKPEKTSPTATRLTKSALCPSG